ncbi:MAG: hypothetical protein GY889_15745 [Proteobacteria bacterium]|nr:hypothetical protein [Pseudomonadota bacterium]
MSTAEYSVTLVGSSATVVFDTAPINAAKIVIRRIVPKTQAVDYVPYDTFPAETHEAALDKLTQVDQQLQEEIDRAMQMPVSDSTTSTYLPLPSAGKALKWNTGGTALENSTDAVDGITSAASASATAAAASATAAAASESNASTSEVNASASSSTSSTNATATAADAVSTAADAVSTAADAVSTAADAATATTQASNASTSATNASSSEADALTYKTASETAKTAAETAKTAAEAAQTAAELAADNFSDVYLGAYASDPTLDNDGDALTAGDMFFLTTTNRMRVYDGSSWADVAVDSATVVAKTSATGSGQLPSGTTAQRDGSPSAGMIRYNSDTAGFEGYGAAWGSIGGGASGTNEEVIYEHEAQVDNTYSIPASTNAMSVGPLVIASGAVITVGSNSTWVII